MARKYYAVRVGRRTGIFSSWEDTKGLVSGFSGAQYKSFKNLQDAEEYMCQGEQNPAKKLQLGRIGQPSVGEDYEEEEDCIVAYVDGSYNSNGERIGWGIILITRHNGVEKQVHRECGELNVSDKKSRQVPGELHATLTAMTYAIKHGYKKLSLYHDYIGIREFAIGGYTAKTPLTKKYVEQYKIGNKYLDVKFHYVPSHTGDYWNEQVDDLAKEGCGLL